MGNKNVRALKLLGDLPNAGSFPASVENEELRVDSPAVGSPKALSFKSYRQGTLITPNFEPAGKTSKPLSAASPEFIPALPVKASTSPEAYSLKAVADPGLPKAPPPTMAEKQPLGLTGSPKTSGASVKQGAIASINQLEPDSYFQEMGVTQPFKNGMSVGSVHSTPEKSGTSNFTTPTKFHETPLSTPSPLAQFMYPGDPQPEKVRFGRADRQKKDVIITQVGVVRNLTRITERITENGYPYQHACADEFQPGVYDVAEVVSKMSAKEREEFWGKNWIEIEVDFRSIEETNGVVSTDVETNGQEPVTKDYDTLLQYIDHLGPDFAAHSKYIFVSILFPSLPATEQSEPAKLSSVRECQQTPEFKHIENLVAKLQAFTSIKRLDVILQTPSNTKKPLSIPQLNLVLPFYDLGFTEWSIKWKTSFMTKAEPVGGWPVHYLDKERNRLLRERERISNATFVRKSQFAV